MDDKRAFLGLGLKFPLQIDELTGKIKTSSYDENIKDSIKIIIGTSKGERVMNPLFGCDIKKFLFESFDYGLSVQIRNCVKEALNNWEPRIENVNVEVNQDKENTSAIIINVSYIVRKTNNPFNLVFPFYLNEGIS